MERRFLAAISGHHYTCEKGSDGLASLGLKGGVRRQERKTHSFDDCNPLDPMLFIPSVSFELDWLDLDSIPSNLTRTGPVARPPDHRTLPPASRVGLPA
eukprot:jgi/Psemu1/306409/fgenesh1_kg.255_\